MKLQNRNHTQALVALAIVVGGAIICSLLGFLEHRMESSTIQVDQASYNAWRDTYAQWSMALLALCGTAIGAWTILLLKRTLDVTRAGNATARQIGQAQVRAYLNIVGAEFIVGRYGHVEIRVELTNFGGSPARYCEITIQLYSPRIYEDRIEATLDYAAPRSGTVFGIPAVGPVWSGWIGFTAPFPELTMTRLYDNIDLVSADVQIRWQDVFGEMQLSEFKLIEIPTAAKLNSDYPPSRIGKMNAIAIKPNDEA